MGVVGTDFAGYGSLELPADLVSELGGGIDTANQIQGLSIGELFLKEKANDYEGADKKRYTKCFLKNKHATDSAYNTKLWLKTCLTLPPAAAIIQLVSTSAADDDSKYVKAIFEKADGTYDSENITMNGLSTVSSIKQPGASCNIKLELRSVASNVLVTAAGNISCNVGSLLGVIPAGYRTADSHIAIGLESTLDDVTTTTDRTTAPGGIVFSRVNTEATGLDCANAGQIPAGSAQGIWLEQTLPDGCLTSAELDCEIGGTCEDA